MEGFKQGQLLRVFVDERDLHGMQPMYTAIVELLRKKHIAGATVFRGIEGYGQHDQIHVGKIFSWAPNLPILIEVVEDKEKIDSVLPDIEKMVTEGFVTIEAAEYFRISKSKLQPHA
ncbi:MAG: DUF190 domain-containing protein [bacterium]|nr:DUF190 domain-containing protein [bacterium]